MKLGDWLNGVLGNTPLEASRLNFRDAVLLSTLLQFGADPSALWTDTVTRDANGCPTSATVTWPDGTAGVYSGTASTTFPATVDAYTITYSSSPTLTVTQAAVTRDANGKITNRPALTIA